MQSTANMLEPFYKMQPAANMSIVDSSTADTNQLVYVGLQQNSKLILLASQSETFASCEKGSTTEWELLESNSKCSSMEGNLLQSTSCTEEFPTICQYLPNCPPGSFQIGVHCYISFVQPQKFWGETSNYEICEDHYPGFKVMSIEIEEEKEMAALAIKDTNAPFGPVKLVKNKLYHWNEVWADSGLWHINADDEQKIQTLLQTYNVTFIDDSMLKLMSLFSLTEYTSSDIQEYFSRYSWDQATSFNELNVNDSFSHEATPICKAHVSWRTDSCVLKSSVDDQLAAMKKFEIISPYMTPGRCSEYCRGHLEVRNAAIHKLKEDDILCTCFTEELPIDVAVLGVEKCPQKCNGYICGCSECQTKSVRIIHIDRDLLDEEDKLNLEKSDSHLGFDHCEQLSEATDMFVGSEVDPNFPSPYLLQHSKDTKDKYPEKLLVSCDLGSPMICKLPLIKHHPQFTLKSDMEVLHGIHGSGLEVSESFELKFEPGKFGTNLQFVVKSFGLIVNDSTTLSVRLKYTEYLGGASYFAPPEHMDPIIVDLVPSFKRTIIPLPFPIVVAGSLKMKLEAGKSVKIFALEIFGCENQIVVSDICDVENGEVTLGRGDEGRCYYLGAQDQTYTFDEAQEKCNLDDSELFIPNSPSKMKLLKQLISNTNGIKFWIGMTARTSESTELGLSWTIKNHRLLPWRYAHIEAASKEAKTGWYLPFQTESPLHGITEGCLSISTESENPVFSGCQEKISFICERIAIPKETETKELKHYKKLEPGKFCEYQEFFVTNELDCEDAANQLNLVWESAKDENDGFPGCAELSGKVVFNKSPSPALDPSDQKFASTTPICYKMPQDETCHEDGVDLVTTDEDLGSEVTPSWRSCWRLCKKTENCTHWTWQKQEKMCNLKIQLGTKTFDANVISGGILSCSSGLCLGDMPTCCTPLAPCGSGEGPCTLDSDCTSGHVCGSSNCPTGGSFTPTSNCCQLPKSVLVAKKFTGCYAKHESEDSAVDIPLDDCREKCPQVYFNNTNQCACVHNLKNGFVKLDCLDTTLTQEVKTSTGYTPIAVHLNRVYPVTCGQPRNRTDWEDLNLLMIDYNPHFPINQKLTLECAFGHVLDPDEISKLPKEDLKFYEDSIKQHLSCEPWGEWDREIIRCIPITCHQIDDSHQSVNKCVVAMPMKNETAFLTRIKFTCADELDEFDFGVEKSSQDEIISSIMYQCVEGGWMVSTPAACPDSTSTCVEPVPPKCAFFGCYAPKVPDDSFNVITYGNDPDHNVRRNQMLSFVCGGMDKKYFQIQSYAEFRVIGSALPPIKPKPPKKETWCMPDDCKNTEGLEYYLSETSEIPFKGCNVDGWVNDAPEKDTFLTTPWCPKKLTVKGNKLVFEPTSTLDESVCQKEKCEPPKKFCLHPECISDELTWFLQSLPGLPQRGCSRLNDISPFVLPHDKMHCLTPKSIVHLKGKYLASEDSDILSASQADICINNGDSAVDPQVSATPLTWKECSVVAETGCSPPLAEMRSFPRKASQRDEFLDASKFTFVEGGCNGEQQVQLELSAKGGSFLHFSNRLNNKIRIATSADIPAAEFEIGTCFRMHFGKCGTDSVSFETAVQKDYFITSCGDALKGNPSTDPCGDQRNQCWKLVPPSHKPGKGEPQKPDHIFMVPFTVKPPVVLGGLLFGDKTEAVLKLGELAAEHGVMENIVQFDGNEYKPPHILRHKCMLNNVWENIDNKFGNLTVNETSGVACLSTQTCDLEPPLIAQDSQFVLEDDITFVHTCNVTGAAFDIDAANYPEEIRGTCSGDVLFGQNLPFWTFDEVKTEDLGDVLCLQPDKCSTDILEPPSGIIDTWDRESVEIDEEYYYLCNFGGKRIHQKFKTKDLGALDISRFPENAERVVSMDMQYFMFRTDRNDTSVTFNVKSTGPIFILLSTKAGIKNNATLIAFIMNDLYFINIENSAAGFTNTELKKTRGNFGYMEDVPLFVSIEDNMIAVGTPPNAKYGAITKGIVMEDEARTFNHIGFSSSGNATWVIENVVPPGMINISDTSFEDLISANCTRNHIAGRLAGWKIEPDVPKEEFQNMTCSLTTMCHWGPGQNIAGRTAPELLAPNDTGVAPMGNHKGDTFLLETSALLVGSKLMYYCNKPGYVFDPLENTTIHGKETNKIKAECIHKAFNSTWADWVWSPYDELNPDEEFATMPIGTPIPICVVEIIESTTVVLPTNAPYEVRFPKTTDYHWPLFYENATQDLGHAETMGPFGFGSGVQLDHSEEECLVDTDFQEINDTCVENPVNCDRGLSVSVFFKMIYDVEPEEMHRDNKVWPKLAKNWPRQYILSTGGDSGSYGGSPGVAIYREGPVVGATVSTGRHTWSVRVLGTLPANNTWSNYAIRWSALATEDDAAANLLVRKHRGDTSVLGGLQLFLDLEMIGMVVIPEDTTNKYNEYWPLEPPTMMLGCHKTADFSNYDGFASGAFDEVAFWTRRIPDNETHVFLGGYKTLFDSVEKDDLVAMMNGVNMSDPSQVDTAMVVMENVIKQQENEDIDVDDDQQMVNETTTLMSLVESTMEDLVDVVNETLNNTQDIEVNETQSTTQAPQLSQTQKIINKMKALINVMNKIVDPKTINTAFTSKSELRIRTKVSKLVGDFVDERTSQSKAWHLVQEDNSEPGAPNIIENMNAYLLKAIQLLMLGAQDLNYRTEVHGRNSFSQMEKMSGPQYRQRKMFEETLRLPLWRVNGIGPIYADNPLDKWREIPESVTVPMEMFPRSCRRMDVTIVATILESFPDPARKNPAAIRAKRIKVDSRIISVAIVANSWNWLRDEFSPPCLPDRALLWPDPTNPLDQRVVIKLTTKSKEKSRRQILFHENEQILTITQRHCAMWNPEFGSSGAWDTQHISTVSMDENGAICKTHKLGTFAIIAELWEQPHRNEDPIWMVVVKYVGYAVSLISLVLFILSILCSSFLWEQFHIINLNLSLGVLVGHLGIMMTEFHVVRDHRHLCTLAGLIMSFGYSASSFLLALLSLACFRAITRGIIVGKEKAYVTVGWGGAIFATGYNVHQHLHFMGNDPRCFLGWENDVKWTFFTPLMAAILASLVLMTVTVCNMAKPVIRRAYSIDDVSSLCRGLMGFLFVYLVVWSWGLLSFVRIPDLELPDFYPAFQIFNSWMGLFVFILLGESSARYRVYQSGAIKMRRKHLGLQALYKYSESEEPSQTIS